MNDDFCQNEKTKSSVGSCSRQNRECEPATNRPVTPANGGPSDLKSTLREKWPEAIRSLADQSELFFTTGLVELDRLFPSGRGIPCGQLIEITGGPSSGKTSLLFRLLAGGPPNPVTPSPRRPELAEGSKGDNSNSKSTSVSTRPPGTNNAAGRLIAYVDFSDSLSPDATISSGIDLSRLLVIKPTDGSGTTISPGIGQNYPTSQNSGLDQTKIGIRTAELLLRDHHVNIVVFDLVEKHTPLPIGLLHRLRLKAVRARGLVIFLTQTAAPPAVDIIPASMASLRLEVQRINHTPPDCLLVTVAKSRICTEGIRLAVHL